MHEKVRKEIWSYSDNEDYTNDELIKENYHGIRPALDTQPLPDHTEKKKIFQLLKRGYWSKFN